MRAKAMGFVCVVILLSLPYRATAQLPVEEVGLALVQQTITAIQSVLMVANQIIDLTPVDGLNFDEGQMGEWLGWVVQMACHPPSVSLSISFTLGSICAEFERMFPARDALPANSYEFREWQMNKNEYLRQSAATAARAQSLIETLGRDSETLLGFLSRILESIGNLQGVQLQHQLLGQQNLYAMRAEAMAATFQRAMTMKIADEATMTESLVRINCNVWRNWPGMACE